MALVTKYAFSKSRTEFEQAYLVTKGMPSYA
jgi:hypothetical protein